MSVEALAVTFDAVNTGRGEQIRARRVKMGMSVKELAMRAGIDRGRLAALEAGEPRVRDTTYGAVERALDLLEQEMGIDAPAATSEPSTDDYVEFRLSGNFGVDVVVRGPVGDMDALEQQVERLLREMRRNGGGEG